MVLDLLLCYSSLFSINSILFDSQEFIFLGKLIDNRQNNNFIQIKFHSTVILSDNIIEYEPLAMSITIKQI